MPRRGLLALSLACACASAPAPTRRPPLAACPPAPAAIIVLGEVARPGRHVLPGPVSLRAAFAAAGGVRPTFLDAIVVTRGGPGRRLQARLPRSAIADEARWLCDGDVVHARMRAGY